MGGRLAYIVTQNPYGETGITKLQGTLTNVGAGAYGSSAPTPLPILAGRVIQIFLGLLGIIFLGLTIYGGYLWMMARGNEQQIEKAKDTIKAGIIGLAIILGAYGIVNIVLAWLLPYTLGE